MTRVGPDQWIVIRRRVAIAGRVFNGAGVPVNGGQLSLQAQLPAKAPRRPARRGADAPPRSRVYETRVRSDGFYFFLDIPAGEYLLDGQDAHGQSIELRSISVEPVIGPAVKPLLGIDLATRKK